MSRCRRRGREVHAARDWLHDYNDPRFCYPLLVVALIRSAKLK